MWFRLVFLCMTAVAILGVGRAPAATIDVFFAPEDEPLNQVIRLYDEARRYIFVATYGITSPRAVKALIEAKKRGVDVRVITDRGKLDDPKQRAALETLRIAGVPIRINQHDGLMHLKQVVVDDSLSASGSMNQTTSGNLYNDERLDVIHDRSVSVKARDKFLSMWQDDVRYRFWGE